MNSDIQSRYEAAFFAGVWGNLITDFQRNLSFTWKTLAKIFNYFNVLCSKNWAVTSYKGNWGSFRQHAMIPCLLEGYGWIRRAPVTGDSPVSCHPSLKVCRCCRWGFREPGHTLRLHFPPSRYGLGVVCVCVCLCCLVLIVHTFIWEGCFSLGIAYITLTCGHVLGEEIGLIINTTHCGWYRSLVYGPGLYERIESRGSWCSISQYWIPYQY